MERLCKTAELTLVVACMYAAFSSPIIAQDYCSLKVRVVTPAEFRTDVPVVVREKNGRTIEKDQDVDAEDVSFCDLGMLPVTVIIGQKGCNQITVEDVPLSWQKTYTLVVNYDYGACMQEDAPPPIPYCTILLRIKSLDGAWVKKARIKFDDSSLPERETDSAGRSLFLLKWRGRVQGSVAAQGYTTKNFSFECQDARHREEFLTLERPEPSSLNGEAKTRFVEHRPAKQSAKRMGNRQRPLAQEQQPIPPAAD